MSKVALITGITGQDGSYLAEFLLEKGYEVHGIVRRASVSNTARIDHLIEKNVIKLHDGDLSDSSGLIRLVGEIRPDEIYNLAAQSHVQVSFDAPEYSGDVDALGVLRVLEAVRVCGLTKTCKVYQASTSELYGKVEEVPQKETTPFHPYSPYAVAKQYGFWMVKEYRDAYGMFAVNGILFNHESERRGENFVTRKITLAAGRIAEGLQDHGELNDKCSGVHIINEMDVPVLAMGLHDVVISASPEGILVSDKEQSSYIKPFVDKFEQQIMFAEKSWGSFKVVDVETTSLTIKVTLNPGHSMNYHSHRNRDEVWVVISGEGKTIVDGMEQMVKPGDVITMSAGCRHTVIADTELKLIEVQLGADINVHDKQKFELEQ